MSKIYKFLFSMSLMGYIVLSLAFAMALATFIENDFGVAASHDAVYNSWWFEVLLLLFIVNLLGSIIISKTYKKKKLSIFLFHFSFFLILAGAAVTRYISYEGTMHIREGETSNVFSSSEKYIYGTLESGDELNKFSLKVNLVQGKNNQFKKSIQSANNKYTLTLTEYRTKTADKGAQGMLTFTITDGSATKDIYVFETISRNQKPASFDFGSAHITLSYGHRMIKLPFSLHLKDFQLERYPGSQSPSSYASEVILTDKEKNLNMPYRIYMNHTLEYKGFKFFQSSYDNDEKGTILSVNHDSLGTNITYIGYLLMAIAMIFSIFNKNSHFMKLARKTGVSGGAFKSIVVVSLMFLANTFAPVGNLNAQENENKTPVIPISAAKEFSSVLLQDANGRIEPFYTMASDILRKTARRSSLSGQNPVQVVLGMYFYPDKWKYEKMIKVTGKIIPELLGINGKYASYSDFFKRGNNYSYKLNSYVQKAYHKRPAERNMFDKDIIKVDERLNVCYLVYSGSLFKIFPVKEDADHKWYSPHKASVRVAKEDSLFVSAVLHQWLYALNSTGEESDAINILSALKEYQKENASVELPSETKVQMEIIYEKYDIFGKLTPWYGLIGFILLFILFSKLLKQSTTGGVAIKITTWLLLIGFIFHAAGLGLRWYISGHAPWSNGYESMIYIAWAAMLAGLIFVKNTPFALAAAAILSALTLMVAHLSWMNPEITNLVPVLKSYWLTIHVSVITASYGFLGMGMIIGLVNLMMYILKTEKNSKHIQQQIEILSNVSEMALILGVYFFGMGTFLGGVWANESWGRYWGWDPKETWSLVTGLIYVFVVHIRMIPGLRGYFAFNIASILAFFSVIMTYFGVNYYLSGLHSYAQGDAVPIPSFVFYALAVLIIMILFAWSKERKSIKD